MAISKKLHDLASFASQSCALPDLSKTRCEGYEEGGAF